MERFLKLFTFPILSVLSGIGANLAVIWANNGKMPVAEISSGQIHGKWTILTDQTNLSFLADILPYQLSLGDLLIIVGLTTYIILVLLEARRRRQNEI